LLLSGESLKGCVQIYEEPVSLANQRLPVEQLALATLPSSVINVSTSSIFQALSHRLSVEAGAVCVSGDMAGIEEFGAVLDLDFQFRPNNGAPLDASGLSDFTFEAEGAHVVRFDAYVPGASYRYLTLPGAAGDVGEGPQRIGFDELFNIFSPADLPLSSLEAPQLDAVRFSLILPGASGPFRFCVSDFVLQRPTAPADAGL
jgi:hypothetical protein